MTNFEEQLLSADDSSEWEGSDYESESERDSDYEDEEPVELPSTTRRRVPKRREREWESASDSEDENGNVPNLVVDIDEDDIPEDNEEAAAIDVSNIISSKRRRVETERFVAEPVPSERTDKWNSFKEMADELNSMNVLTPSHATCDRYKSMLKNAIAETPSFKLSMSTGWLTAVKSMPDHRKLTKWKRRLVKHLHKEWAEEAKRVHFKTLVKIAKTCAL